MHFLGVFPPHNKKLVNTPNTPKIAQFFEGHTDTEAILVNKDSIVSYAKANVVSTNCLSRISLNELCFDYLSYT